MTEQNGRPRLLIRGIHGLLKDEERWLAVGEAVVIGRSRHVDFSTRRARRLEGRDNAAEIIRSNAFNSVSRRHVRIHFLHPDLVEIKDLSSNGTYLDGRRITCVAVQDLADETHIVSLGRQEKLHLQIMNGAGGNLSAG